VVDATRFFARLAAWGITPNAISWSGFLATFLCGVSLALGAGDVLPTETGSMQAPVSWWPLVAFVFISLASALDLLDGGLARHLGTSSPYGAMLDSTLDRLSDIAIFVGCSVYFAGHANMTWTLISGLALTGTVMISYVKARGENLTEGLGMGYWQRGERCALLIWSTFTGRVPAALFVLALFPLLTVVRRYLEAKRKLAGPEALSAFETAALDRAPQWSRLTPPFLTLAAGIAGFVFVAPRIFPFFRGVSDPLGALLR